MSTERRSYMIVGTWVDSLVVDKEAFEDEHDFAQWLTDEYGMVILGEVNEDDYYVGFEVTPIHGSSINSSGWAIMVEEKARLFESVTKQSAVLRSVIDSF